MSVFLYEVESLIFGLRFLRVLYTICVPNVEAQIPYTNQYLLYCADMLSTVKCNILTLITKYTRSRKLSISPCDTSTVLQQEM